ncbi:MAG TPA: hypothetical protein VKR06_43770 [Ktedonosporobacter sp.]|nr:hypothetical protein [Ktedonosporobacter sp.]
MALVRAAHRMRANVRTTDYVLLSGSSCVIVLPQTLFEGAQTVAQRCHILLADIEYELQIVSGIAAQIRLRQLYEDRALVVMPASEHATLVLRSTLSQKRETDTLPYLAFLSSYPPYEVLHLFPYELACRYRCVPVGVERSALTLALCQRLEQEIISHFCEVTQKEIFQVRCEASMIDDMLSYWHNAVPV